MGPSFPPHPAAGMQQHPGAPTHPMGAPGMIHNPSQPGAQQGGMPHQLVPHMGASAAGGQLNPGAMMGGMPPGAGVPNAHAMQHLNPAQAQMFQPQHLSPMACKCCSMDTHVCSFLFLVVSLLIFPSVAANNQALQQMRQQQQVQQLQQMQQQQHARQQAMMQQAYGNMGGMPMGLPMNGMNPAAAAQMAAMRAARMPQQQNPQAQVSCLPH